MAKRQPNDRRSLEEATAWFTRLKQDSVSEASIEDFFAWRRTPANGAAYAEVEARWRQADNVRNDPELVHLTEMALRREAFWPRLRRRLRSPILPLGFAATAVLVAAAIIVVGPFRPPTYETAVGAQQIVRLEDGSVLRLNTDSKATVRYSRHERRLVLLRGEGFFEVAHDAARPFVVEAGPAQVTALGTKFDVRRAGAATHVTLLEGHVQVARPSRSETWTLKPDQQITLDGAASGPRATDATDATSWTTGRLRFRETPLAAAVEDVNRYSRNKIILEANHLGPVRVSGMFDTGDSQAFISAVCELFDLEAVPGPEGTTLRARRAPGGA